MKESTTIAAISTAQAPGGIGVIRISGPEARSVADKVFFAKNGKKVAEMKGYTAAFGEVYARNGEKLDDAVLLLFAGPKSYTGEDVAEISCHGGLYVTQRVLREVLEAGAELAGPGEFTRRAFLHGKMDLAQAESIMQLIGASGEQAFRAAEAVSDGRLSKRIEQVRGKLLELASHLSAWADFPEEEVPEVEEAEISFVLEEAKREFQALLSGFDSGKVFREGLYTVIAGRPNAGKSTLMNLLAGCERSIVTQYAGTTRDVVEETVLLGGIPLRLADTAGIRETDDPVETIGVTVTKAKLRTAQLVLAVFDGSQPLEQEDFHLIELLDGVPVIAVVNKNDLENSIQIQEIKANFSHVVFLSAITGSGLENLEMELKKLLQVEAFDPSAGILCTERQRIDIRRALSAIDEAKAALDDGLTFDAVTVCVEDALSALFSLTGERVSEEIVDQVFESFCVGK